MMSKRHKNHQEHSSPRPWVYPKIPVYDYDSDTETARFWGKEFAKECIGITKANYHEPENSQRVAQNIKKNTFSCKLTFRDQYPMFTGTLPPYREGMIPIFSYRTEIERSILQPFWFSRLEIYLVPQISGDSVLIEVYAVKIDHKSPTIHGSMYHQEVQTTLFENEVHAKRSANKGPSRVSCNMDNGLKLEVWNAASSIEDASEERYELNVLSKL